ncbi:hypothetical protein CH63R_13850 [Colletotrichum higginsianum IMI 349063]|uniref:Uncharacterized protein n=1 Tax=Colletotrichum higginsianum (strain IMI 349063) TaxID=759273 RepID=A0A1B7XSC2_COLHI|nr:hypothetical protein CH63R_13850 [Colletotrichum higginsianum IMI 349063]OBR02624.1 hypothetical protein CH63R_13850 [Colletotrichum higginsianum IMI 349063]
MQNQTSVRLKPVHSSSAILRSQPSASPLFFSTHQRVHPKAHLSGPATANSTHLHQPHLVSLNWFKRLDSWGSRSTIIPRTRKRLGSGISSLSGTWRHEASSHATHTSVWNPFMLLNKVSIALNLIVRPRFPMNESSDRKAFSPIRWWVLSDSMFFPVEKTCIAHTVPPSRQESLLSIDDGSEESSTQALSYRPLEHAQE